jgi:predicted PurR-regulated permease PerM
MNDPEPLKSSELEDKSLLALVGAATLLFAVILWPFFGALCWAVFIAIVFWPLNERFLRNSHGSPSMAAAASLTVVLLIVILPITIIIASIAQEASVLVAKLRSGEIQLGPYFQRFIVALPVWAQNILERFGLAELGLLQQKLLDSLGSSGQAITSRAFLIGQITLDLVIGFFVMIYVMFFLFRDGVRLSQKLARAIPLRDEHKHRLLTKFATVVRATVKGNIVVAVVQGTLGGLAFWVLGVPGVMLWGAVMAVLSLLPAVGAALVWGPAALYFFFSGELVKGFGLTAWGVIVIGLVDNFLRPILVGRDTRIPDYLVLVATLGGLVVFGLNGFVIGPVIAAIFLVAWDMLATARGQPLKPPPPGPGEPPANPAEGSTGGP